MIFFGKRTSKDEGESLKCLQKKLARSHQEGDNGVQGHPCGSLSSRTN